MHRRLCIFLGVFLVLLQSCSLVSPKPLPTVAVPRPSSKSITPSLLLLPTQTVAVSTPSTLNSATPQPSQTAPLRETAASTATTAVSPTFTAEPTATFANATAQPTSSAITITQYMPVRSIDLRHLTQDFACRDEITPPVMDQIMELIIAAHANYVAIASPLDNVHCDDGHTSNALTRITEWVAAARKANLHIWFRLKHSSAQGFYNTPKNADPEYQIKVHTDFITAHPELFAVNDIYAVNTEPQNMGIENVNCYRGNTQECTFQGENFEQGRDAFNRWLVKAYAQVGMAFDDIGLGDKVKVGYFGYDGYIAFRDRNPGPIILLPETILATGNNVTFDHGYGEIDQSLNYEQLQGYFPGDQLLAQGITQEKTTGRVNPYVEYGKIRMYFDSSPELKNAELCIGEWGPADGQSPEFVNAALEAMFHFGIICYNYDNLGIIPANNEEEQPKERLVTFVRNSAVPNGISLTTTSYYDVLRTFFLKHSSN